MSVGPPERVVGDGGEQLGQGTVRGPLAAPDEVAEQRRVEPRPAVVGGDAREREQRLGVGVGERDGAGVQAGRGGDPAGSGGEPRIHGASVSGAVLLGGASRRFGAPKALAEVDGEPMGVRVHRRLAEALGGDGHVIGVGKAALGLELPFAVLDDATERQAPIFGVLAALRATRAELLVVVPVDMPRLTAASLRSLPAALIETGAEVAVFPRGPLPCALRASVLDRLERVSGGSLRAAFAPLRGVTVACPEAELLNVNRTSDLPGSTGGPTRRPGSPHPVGASSTGRSTG